MEKKEYTVAEKINFYKGLLAAEIVELAETQDAYKALFHVERIQFYIMKVQSLLRQSTRRQA